LVISFPAATQWINSELKQSSAHLNLHIWLTLAQIWTGSRYGFMSC